MSVVSANGECGVKEPVVDLVRISRLVGGSSEE